MTNTKQLTRIVTGEYILDCNPQKDYIRISRNSNESANVFLALKPGGGWDFNGLHSLLTKKCIENKAGVTLTITGKLAWGAYRMEIYCPRAEPGLVNSRVYIGKTEPSMQPASLFSGQHPELSYISQKSQDVSGTFRKLIYYLNGKPGSYTYHTVSNDSTGIIDLNQFIYFGDPDVLGSTLQYYEDFTSLNPFFNSSGTRILNSVRQPSGCLGSPDTDQSGQKATFGFDIPETVHKIKVDSFMLVANSWLKLTPGVPTMDQSPEYCNRFINGVSSIFPYLQKPESKFIDWPPIVEQGLGDMITSRQQTGREAIFPAANLLSIRSYIQQFGSKNGDSLGRNGWDKDWKTLRSVLPYSDAWQYLFRLIMAGEYYGEFHSKAAGKLFMDEANDVILAGQKLNYRFPFRIKADFSRSPSVRYEYDCTGAYVYLMLLYFKETGEQRFLKEARAAGNQVLKTGFEYPYEFTTTAIGPVAMLRLYKVTGDRSYLKGVSVPLAAIFRHSWLFNPDYGVYHGRTIFMLTEGMPGVYANGWEEGVLIHYLKDLLIEGNGILPSQSWKMTAAILRWKGISAADALAPLLADKSIIYSGIPREWVMKIQKSSYIPMEGFGYLEWDNSGLHNKPGRVSQSPYCFSMLPEAAMLLFHQLPDQEQLYVETPVLFRKVSTDQYSFELLANDGTYHACIKTSPKKRSVHVEELLGPGKTKEVKLSGNDSSAWRDFSVRRGIKYIMKLKQGNH